jgi:urease accessory protein
MAPPVLIWQLADSAFPTGGFAHSGGLEAAAALGELPDAAALSRYLRLGLCQAGHSLLPLMNEAYLQPTTWLALDALCDVSLTNHVANRASRAQGLAWLSSAASVFASARLIALKRQSASNERCGHLAPLFGVVAAELELPLDEAQRLFLYLQLRGLVGSAVRLNLIGPLAAQRLQHQLSDALEAVRVRCAGLGPNDMAQITPTFDVWQAHHDRLYARLFSS